MKVILTGATGAAGLEILRSAIQDPAISHISVLTRRSLPSHLPSSPKVSEIRHSDFLTYPPELLDRLKGHGACIWALGTSANGMDEQTYMRLTHDYPLAAIKAFNEAGVKGDDGVLRFVYISGEGADETGKSRMLFARVKGRTETDLNNYAASATSSSLKVYNLRPGYFYPSNSDDAALVRSQVLRSVHKFVMNPLFTIMPSLKIKTEDLALFALEAGKGRVAEGMYRNTTMLEQTRTWRKEAEAQK